MKIHHTIHIPKDYPRRDSLEAFLYEKYSSDLHDFDLKETDVESPMFTSAEVPDSLRMTTVEGATRSLSEVHFGVQVAVKRFLAQDGST